MTLDQAATRQTEALIVGAGISGLYMLHRLRQLGVQALVLEAGDGVGGTWYWNRYPGARCDIESLDYSYSFSDELQQEWEWTERYPGQPEILRYVNHVADRFGLRDGVQFDTRVLAADWDDAEHRWVVTTDGGERISAKFCIMATGCLSSSKTPEVEGIDGFEGDWYHTGHWPHAGVDFSGQRVGVVGTGSSGIQCIPIIAEQAAHLTVFQRTPNYAVPAGNAPLPSERQARVKAAYPEFRQAARASMFGVDVAPPTESALEVDPDERRAHYEDQWAHGTLITHLLTYNDVLVDEQANETAAEFVRTKIRETVTDPEVAELLTPRDYPFGTKRLCLETNYYSTFNRDNVDLVDVRSSPIVAVLPGGIRTVAGDYELDSIVFATGFDAMTGALTNIDIRGKDGQVLKDKWAEGPRTYLGLGVAGFPNLFTITGPGSPSVLTNMLVSIEQHVQWIADCITFLRERNLGAIEATPEAEAAWVDHVREVGDATLFPRANSWYMGANVPGKPRVFLPYLGFAPYKERCDEVAAKDYEGFALTPA